MRAGCSSLEHLSVFPYLVFSCIFSIVKNKEISEINMNGTRNKKPKSSENKQFLKNLTPCIQGVILLDMLALGMYDC